MSYRQFHNEDGEEYGSFETYYLDANEIADILDANGITEESSDEDREEFSWMEPGFYWAAGFPGCLHDGEPTGPFFTERGAVEDADEWHDVAELDAEFGPKVEQIEVNELPFLLHIESLSEELASALFNCAGPGKVDNAVRHVVETYTKPGNPDAIRRALDQVGAWTDEQLEDDAENLHRMIFVLTGDFAEGSDTAALDG